MSRLLPDMFLGSLLVLPYMSDPAFEPPRTRVNILIGDFKLEVIDQSHIRIWTIIEALVTFFSGDRSTAEQSTMAEGFEASHTGRHSFTNVKNKTDAGCLRYVDFLGVSTVLGGLVKVAGREDTWRMYLVRPQRLNGPRAANDGN